MSYVEIPLLCCCHSFDTSSIDSLDASSRVEVTVWRSTIQSRICRTQCQGSAQSNKRTSRLSGTDCGVKRGLSRDANDGGGSERR